MMNNVIDFSNALGIFFWFSIAIATLMFLDLGRLRFFSVGLALLAVITSFWQFGQLGSNDLAARLLILASSITGLAIIIAAPRQEYYRDASFSIALIQAANLTFLATQSPILKFIAWLLALTPLIVGCEGLRLHRRRQVSRGYLAFQIAGLFFLGLALILLKLDQALASPIAGFFLLLAGALRQGLFPFHVPQRTLFRTAPMGLILALMNSEMGIGLIVQSALPLLQGTWLIHSFQVTLVIALAYYAMLALHQSTLRDYLCLVYLFASALMCLCYDASGQNQVSGILMDFSATLTISGLGLITWLIETRIGRARLDNADGLFGVMPRLGVIYTIFGLALCGSPLTLGFVAEDLWVRNLWAEAPFFAVIGIMTTSILAIAHLKSFAGLFLGWPKNHGHITDAWTRERIGLVLLLVPLLVLGIAPQLLTEPWTHSLASALNDFFATLYANRA